MHSKPNSPVNSRIASRRPALGLLTLISGILIAGCISDGPNHTGGSYLNGHQLLLETPLHQVKVAGFPVDSFWTTDVEPGRLGDSVVMAGRWNGFTSQIRLAFDLSDTAFLDSLAAANTLKLSVGFPRPVRSESAFKATANGVDSMRFLVESWVLRDDGLTKEARADSLKKYNRLFLIRQDTAAFLDSGSRHLDTVTIRVKTAYGADSLQAMPLPNLREELTAGGHTKWMIMMQLTHLPVPGDTTAAMLRLGGEIGSVYSTLLLFGNATSALTAVTKTQKLLPLITAEGTRRGVNSKLRFYGSSNSILIGKTRGLHLRIDRTALLDSLEDVLLRTNGQSLKRTTTGEFDLSYFVPFAKFTMPLNSVRIEGDFPMEMSLQTDMDSLLDSGPALNGREIPFGLPVDFLVLKERLNPSKVLDTLTAKFEKALPDSASPLRRFIIRSRRDTTVQDTSYYDVGQEREIAWSVRGFGNDRLNFSVKAQDSFARIDWHLNAKSETEDNGSRDLETGERQTNLSDRIPLFLQPLDRALGLRATRGFQRLLNRVKMGQGIESDFFIQPVAAADSSTKLRVPYPVLGEIRPDIQGGKLKIDINVFLYPLKDRP